MCVRRGFQGLKAGEGDRLQRIRRTWTRFFCPFWREAASLAVNKMRGDVDQSRVRVNEQIRMSPVRLIGADGEQVGIVPIEEAQQAAAERGLDLVEVAAMARPPVVKVMDYGKYRFEQAKAARAAKKKQHIIHLKEVKYRPGISGHDFDFKTRHARRVLEEGNKVEYDLTEGRNGKVAADNLKMLD